MQLAGHLDKRVQDALGGLIDGINALCGDNLISVYLYGSAAGKGHISEESNLNTLILLKNIDMDRLRGIAHLYRKHRKSRVVAPLVLTPDYIRSSGDVFPIEFLDIKEGSILLAGKDAFKEVSIDLASLRGQCEREIKGQLVRMRSSFIEVEGDRKGMETLITAAVSSLVFPLKHILRLMKQGIPEGNDNVIKACCKILDVNDSPFLDALSIKGGDSRVSMEGLYAVISGYLVSLEGTAGKIDALKSEGRL